MLDLARAGIAAIVVDEATHAVPLAVALGAMAVAATDRLSRQNHICQALKKSRERANISALAREYNVARAFLDARVQTIYGGTTEIMKEIIGRSLGV